MGKCSGFLNLTGYIPEEVVDKKPGHILQGPDTDPETVNKMNISISECKPCKVDILNYTKQQKPYWLRLTIYPVYDQDTHIGFIGIQFDITDKYDSELKLKVLNDILHEEIIEKNRLISIISHDILNMVQTTKGVTEILMNNKHMNYEQIKCLDILDKNCRSIDDLLRTAIKSVKNKNISEEKINIKEVIADAVSYNDPNLKLKHIFAYNISGECYIKAKYLHILVILNNIISNSIKFTPRYGTIGINTNIKSDIVDIIITDTGIGIDGKKLESIFQNKINKNTKGTNGESGTGNGLIFVEDLVKKNGGTIRIESKLDVGTKTTITFTWAND